MGPLVRGLRGQQAQLTFIHLEIGIRYALRGGGREITNLRL